jgi:hydroxymethylpyrimidine pyrophosphatase-like HAD family hydrolase
MSDIVTFDPAEILTQLIEHLPEAHFAVEDVDGSYRFHRPFPTYALGDQNFETPLEELMHHPVSRVVVLSPQHDVDEFLGLISKIGLASVSYAIGYTAWLDISPKGVTKASALENQRARLGISSEQVLVMGDGRNDIEMFEWAKKSGGLAFAMGQAPEEVQLAATNITSSVTDDGVARVLAGFEGILFSRKDGATMHRGTEQGGTH